MKVSKYNFYIKNENNIITFNSLTQRILITDYFNPTDKGMLKYCKNKENQLLFRKNGMLIPFYRNQKKELKNKIKTSTYPQDMYVRILLSYKCNFKCSYCYESLDDHNPSFLFEQDGEQKVKNFLLKYCKTRKIKTLIISWYGGEPFLFYKDIIKFSNNIKLSLSKYSINYEAEIITNGSFEGNEKCWFQLANCGIKKIIFSIDGFRESHNMNRPYIFPNNKNQYEILLHNAKNWSKYGKSVLSIMLRNINISEYKKIINDIKNEVGLRNTSIFLGKLSDINNNLSSMIKKSFLSHRHFIEYKLNLYSYASNLGFNVEPYRFLPFFNGCVEMLESGYSITPNGDIYKCHESICNKKYIVSNISEYNNILRQNHKVFPSPYTDSFCKKCRLLPICKGGCPKRYFERKRHICLFRTTDGYNFLNKRYKSIFESSIKSYLYHMKKKENNEL